MTVIACRKYPDRIAFAADSMLSIGDNHIVPKQVTNHCKLIQQNSLVVGASGLVFESELMGVFSRNHKPARADLESVLDFFLDFRDWARKKDESLKPGNSYLICLEGKVFESDNALRVSEVVEFSAIGCGWQYALTAMTLGQHPEGAVQTTINLSQFCGGAIQTIVEPIVHD